MKCFLGVVAFYIQLSMLKSDVLGKDIFLQVVCYLTCPLMMAMSNFA